MSAQNYCAACGEYMPPHAPHTCAQWPPAKAMDQDAVRALVAEQANDEGLWFEAENAAEAYLQKALRRLHAVIEGKTGDERAVEVLSKSRMWGFD